MAIEPVISAEGLGKRFRIWTHSKPTSLSDRVRQVSTIGMRTGADDRGLHGNSQWRLGVDGVRFQDRVGEPECAGSGPQQRGPGRSSGEPYEQFQPFPPVSAGKAEAHALGQDLLADPSRCARVPLSDAQRVLRRPGFDHRSGHGVHRLGTLGPLPPGRAASEASIKDVCRAGKLLALLVQRGNAKPDADGEFFLPNFPP